jgi:hypothetical protein
MNLAVPCCSSRFEISHILFESADLADYFTSAKRSIRSRGASDAAGCQCAERL